MSDYAYLTHKSNIDKSKDDLEQFLVYNNVSPTLVAKLLIVIDEIVSNIVFYGEAEHGVFTISADIKDGTLTLVFKDNGVKFNPLTQEEPDIKLPAKERDVGGLGILIVKKIADSLEYEYRENCNILTFKKAI